MEISFNHKHEVYHISVVGVFKKLEKSKGQLPILPFKIIHFYIGFFATCITRSRRKKRNTMDMVNRDKNASLGDCPNQGDGERMQ